MLQHHSCGLEVLERFDSESASPWERILVQQNDTTMTTIMQQQEQLEVQLVQLV